MNRDKSNLGVVYHVHIENNIKQGLWDACEKERIVAIVNRLIQYNHENHSPLRKINLRIVSDFVGTRSLNSCQNFVQMNKPLVEKLIVGTLLSRYAMTIYLNYSNICSEMQIDWYEMILLYNGKFDELQLKAEVKKLMLEVNNYDFKAG